MMSNTSYQVVDLPNTGQAKIRDAARKKLNKIEKIIQCKQNAQKMDEFKRKYDLCDSIYQLIFDAYKQVTGNSKKGLIRGNRRTFWANQNAGKNER